MNNNLHEIDFRVIFAVCWTFIGNSWNIFPFHLNLSEHSFDSFFTNNNCITQQWAFVPSLMATWFNLLSIFNLPTNCLPAFVWNRNRKKRIKSKKLKDKCKCIEIAAKGWRRGHETCHAHMFTALSCYWKNFVYKGMNIS